MEGKTRWSKQCQRVLRFFGRTLQVTFLKFWGMNRTYIARLVAVCTAGLLAGCGGTPETVTETVTETVGETVSQPPASDSAPQPDPEPAEPERGVPGAPLAYPGAGGPIPPNARPIATVKRYEGMDVDYAVFTTPSGNIGCMMNLEDDPMFDCGVESYMETEQYGIGELGMTRWMVEVLHGYVREQNEPPLYSDLVWPEGSPSAEVVQYGEVVYHGPFVCAVEETGVTCWDSESGRGAWMERENTVFF